MADSVVDPQAPAWGDDSSTVGYRRVALVKSGLVPVPFRFGFFLSGTDGGTTDPSSGVATASAVVQNLGIAGYGELGHSEIQVTVDKRQYVTIGSSAGTPIVPYATLRTVFYGKVLGIAIDPIGAWGLTNVRAVIDGVAQTPPAPVLVDFDTASGSLVGTSIPLWRWIINENLSEKMHELKLHFVGDQNGVTNNTWALFCMLLESRVGYQPPQPSSMLAQTKTLVDNVQRSLFSLGFNNISYISRVRVYNPTGSDITMTLADTYGTFAVFNVPTATYNDSAFVAIPPRAIDTHNFKITQSVNATGLVVSVDGVA